MGVYKQIAYAAVNASSDTSLTSIVYIPPDFTDFCVQVPALLANTGTCGINLLVSDANTTTTFIPMYYAQNQMDIKTVFTTNAVYAQWYSPASVASQGGYVICPAIQYAPSYIKFQFLRTATANTGLTIWGRKVD
jgi:ABC-type microcin C transport system permease subunit YejE